MKRILYILFLLTFSLNAVAQYQSRGKEFDYDDAENFFKNENYYDALPLYESLYANYPKVYEYPYKIGLCYLNLTTYPEKAIEYLEISYEKKSKQQDLLFYLAKAYHLNYQFDKALEYFEKAEKSSKTSEENKLLIPYLKQQCLYGKELIQHQVSATIENIGEPINKSDNEYSPLVTADEQKIIFTYRGVNSKGGRQNNFNEPDERGNYYEDVFYSTKDENGKWTTPKPLSDTLNTKYHEASISISPDGQILYIYRDVPESNGDIFYTSLTETGWAPLQPFQFNTNYWEGSASISPNGKVIIFSSDRPGGKGGRDLYITVKDLNGNWSTPQNLGDKINTAFDDDAPFIHPDGRTVTFSSKGHNSMGGYDIFETKMNGVDNFTQPKNIGFPINTTANDVFFVAIGKNKAYYSSARKGGFGQQDIYVISTNDILDKSPVILVKGTVKLNNEGISAQIKVRSVNVDSVHYLNYQSNPKDGSYLFYLDINNYYAISYELEGHPTQIEIINGKEIKTYTEIEKNINFYDNDKKVLIKGTALKKEHPLSPIMNAKVKLSNKSNSLSILDTTDTEGRFYFDNLPQDDYYLMFLDENDEKLLEDSTYIFKGKVTLEGLPYSGLHINDIVSEDDGTYKIMVQNKHRYQALTGDLNGLSELNWEDPDLYVKLLDKYGDKTATGLLYTVQIAAYNNPSNYSYSHLKSLGTVKKTLLEDGITRFTIGEFKTLKEANDFKEKVVNKGQEDAFVILFLNGKRTYLSEVIKKGILK
ncbi:MAG: OmpA family protein [Vicingaceae bacterium]